MPRPRGLSFTAPGPMPRLMLESEAQPLETAGGPDPLDAYSAAVVGAVGKVGPAVVSVYTGGAEEAARARVSS